MGAVIRSMITGDRTNMRESEIHALGVGTDAAGGWAVPSYTSDQIIDFARAQSVVSAAGAVTIPVPGDQLTIAKLATDPVVHFYTAGDTIDSSAGTDPTFAGVVLIAQEDRGHRPLRP